MAFNCESYTVLHFEYDLISDDPKTLIVHPKSPSFPQSTMETTGRPGLWCQGQGVVRMRCGARSSQDGVRRATV